MAHPIRAKLAEGPLQVRAAAADMHEKASAAASDVHEKAAAAAEEMRAGVRSALLTLKTRLVRRTHGHLARPCREPSWV